MEASHNGRTSTRISAVINAPRAAVYAAFLDPGAVASWLPPETMTGRVNTFEARAGGKFGMSLTYEDPAHSPGGKTTEDTDTFAGTFAELVPDEKIVWVVRFESDDPEYAGEMTVTWTLEDADGGTEVTVLCANIPKGIRLEDNEMGSRSSLGKLAAFVE